MPLFKTSPPPPQPATEPAPAPSPMSSRLFHRRAPSESTASGISDYRSAASHPTIPSEDDNRSVRSGFFFRRRASDDSLRSPAPSITPSSFTSASRHRGTDTPHTSPEPNLSRSSSLASRFSLRNFASRDPAVVMARQKVEAAREAEAEADRAIMHARARVRDALGSVKELEEEAHEGALRAKAKQAESKLVSRHAGFLGKHGQ
ncbi:hypothetical protein FB45DRAFT_6297 [Roridomyces roridus]|uniref:Uncharacterized protein n=1 Tax=Roridomyces roridus TaxID=1738132 RepID=A0AAD7FYF9_9AGAR|nr:hypothetical protein FB45DRAFT_6297 [Roridomyces roridus]